MNNSENEESKYYIPDIEDLRVGYEYEFQGIPKGWHKMIFSEENSLKNIKYNIEKLTDAIRVPYLTKEQIESEGWTEIHDREYIKEKSTPDLRIIYWFSPGGKKYLSKFEKRYKGVSHTIFEGDCPSINEFRYICKLLGI